MGRALMAMIMADLGDYSGFTGMVEMVGHASSTDERGKGGGGQ